MDQRDQRHKVEISIIAMLRQTESLRFSDLKAPTGLESDVFKFHIRKLVKLGYIEKGLDGRYRLTASGKYYASIINQSTRTIRQQPILSMLMIVSQNFGGEILYLRQQRLRNPFIGYWGYLSTHLQAGVDITKLAEQELNIQSGLKASFKVKAFYRQITFEKTTEKLLDDRLFSVVEAYDISGDITNHEYKYGLNKWMTLEECSTTTPHFGTIPNFIDKLNSGVTYFSSEFYVDSKQF